MLQGKISVLMGIYNCADTLGGSIESIIAQTYQNWQLILCDDGSSDNTYEVAKSYADREPRILLIKNEHNIKLGPTLNHCLEYADGEFSARMDGDDFSTPDRFEKQTAFLNTHPEIDVVGSFMQAYGENGENKIRSTKEFPQLSDLPRGNPCCHATIMMRTSVFKEIGGYSSSPKTERVEDVDMFWRFYESGHRAANIQEPLYIVREDENTYKRRKLRFYVNSARVIFKGCRRTKMPVYCYLFALKKIVGGLLPNRLMLLYHSVKDKKSVKKDAKE